MRRRDEIPNTNGSVLPEHFQETDAGLFAYERYLWQLGLTRIAGVDEAGRGPLAGPVVAAAVIFEPGTVIEGVNDSKKLVPEQRDRLFDVIRGSAIAFGIGIVSPETIDSINILQATMLAMKQAVESILPKPQYLLIDGSYYSNNEIPATTIVKGDSRSFSIAAASIIAKVTRDRFMAEIHRLYPEYGFDQHKGYGTAKHLAAISKHGRCPVHRASFHVDSIDGPRSSKAQLLDLTNG